MNLDEIKEQYGKGRKILSANNYDLEGLKALCEDKLADKVKVLFVTKHYVVLDLNDGADQWQILDALKALNVDVKTFGAYEPSLNDIFVSKVGEEVVVEEEETPEEATPKKKGLFGKGGK